MSEQQVPFSTLRFSGRMNAHISHDLKNVTATVTETAKLMYELIEIKGPSGSVDPAKLMSLSQRIVNQLERGNKLLKHMNTFAHSTDEPEKTLDLRTTVELMANLASCLPFRRAINLKLPDQPLEMTTRPYLVEQYCYLIYRASFENMPTEQSMELSLQPAKNGCVITIGPLPQAPEGPLLAKLDALAEALYGKSTFDPGSSKFSLSLTK